MSRIFWDTNLFIYLLEGEGESYRLVQCLLERMAQRRDELLTSTLTLGELLVKPLEEGRTEAAERIETFLDSPGVRILPFDRESARIFAGIRRDRSVRPPDAIQLACASAAGTDLFVTNDARLSRKSVPGIQFIVPLDRAFL